MAVGNNVVIIGRLTHDPELKTTPSGASVMNFSLARNRAKDKNGEVVADFFDCVALGSTAEMISKYFTKGNRIGVIGELRTRIWEDKSGAKRKTTEILVSSVEFIEKKNEGGNAVERPEPTPKTKTYESPDNDVDTDEDEELPF